MSSTVIAMGDRTDISWVVGLCVGIMATGDLPLREQTLCLRGATLLIHSSQIDSELVHSDRLRWIQMDPSKYKQKGLEYF